MKRVRRGWRAFRRWLDPQSGHHSVPAPHDVNP